MFYMYALCISTVRLSFVQFKCRYSPPNYFTVLPFNWTLRFYFLRFTYLVDTCYKSNTCYCTGGPADGFVMSSSGPNNSVVQNKHGGWTIFPKLINVWSPISMWLNFSLNLTSKI